MKEHVIGNDIIGEIDFREPLKNNATQAAEKAQQWAKEIIQNMKNP